MNYFLFLEFINLKKISFINFHYFFGAVCLLDLDRVGGLLDPCTRWKSKLFHLSICFTCCTLGLKKWMRTAQGLRYPSESKILLPSLSSFSSTLEFFPSKHFRFSNSSMKYKLFIRECRACVKCILIK